MSYLGVNHDKCILCGVCVDSCPFGALKITGKLEVLDSCRLCKVCIKVCPEKALSVAEGSLTKSDLSSYRNVLVFAEQRDGELAGVVFELIGKGRELADKLGEQLNVVLLGHKTESMVEQLSKYPVDSIFVYDHQELTYYRPQPYASALEDLISHIKPSIFLIGATHVGRSLAPRIATRLRTGLTADCTVIDVKPNGELVQIRPAFGGNVMAQIVTPNHRPQFATVRPKVMQAAELAPSHPTQVIYRELEPEKLLSNISFLSIEPKPKETSITEADILICVGRGLRKAEDLAIVEELAEKLGGMVAVTRPLVEAGWAPQTRQVGLSGRTVRPKLFIACGVSGAIQMVAGMSGSEYIIAINKDKNAPIFEVAHLGLVGDMYEILPALVEELGRTLTKSKESR